MVDAGSASEVAKELANPWTTFVEWLAELLPEGPAQHALILLLGLCALGAPFIYRYYHGLLGQGAQPEGSTERQDYDRLRAELAGNNLAARLYARWLKIGLDAVDGFFGDAGRANRTLFPHAFGLRNPAPLWTAPAFNRCLLLALIYPIVTIFVIWAISGHVGPAEAALGLQPDLPGWTRGSMAAAVGFQGYMIWRFRRAKGWKSRAWFALAFAVASAGAFAATGAVAGAFPFAAVVAAVTAVALTSIFLVFLALSNVGHGGIVFIPFFALALAVAFAVAAAFTFASAGVSAFGIVGAVIVAFIFAFVLTIAIFVFVFAINIEPEEASSALILPVMVLACLDAAFVLSPLKIWGTVGPLLLFLGLLTLLNAPFNWTSLGLTRALLRRGLELGGWWPYLLALVDAALAAVTVALLALVMIVGVQVFDALAAHGGGAPVLPLNPLLDGIAKHPAAPEYWWVYGLLLSTMIPSLINLVIGGMALTRGVPWLARLLLHWMPAGRAVPEYRRQLMAIGLTVQMFAGVGLGIAAQAAFAIGVIAYVMPAVGLDLLDMARAVAVFDLPARAGALFSRAP